MGQTKKTLFAIAVCVFLLWSYELSSRAVATSTIRVMTYNIHVGMGMDKRLDLPRIAAVIKGERPDLVALQEVDRGVQRTQRIDEIVELAKLTKMDYAFAHNLDFQGGQYGVAILSRYPIVAIDHRRFLHLREAERRGFIRVEVLVKGRIVHFVNTHLDYQHADNRLFEAKQLWKALEGISGPLIVAGDLNDEPAGDTYKFLKERFADTWNQDKGPGLTYPADNPVKRIDYVFLRESAGLKARSTRVVSTLASDHLPLVVDLELFAAPTSRSNFDLRCRSEHRTVGEGGSTLPIASLYDLNC